MKMLPKIWNGIIKDIGFMSMQEFRILLLLDNTPKPLRSFDIAHKLLMDRAAVSRNKDKLEKRGLIACERNGKDRRDSLLSLTPKGREVVSVIDERLGSLTSKLYSDLGTDEAEQMNSWHKKMYEGLLERINDYKFSK